MNQRVKKTISIIAIVIASVAAGVIVSADMGWMRASLAQQQTVPTAQGPVPAVTLPSFADVADQIMPAVVTIRTTEIVTAAQRRGGGGVDPFDFFFPERRRPGMPPEQDDQRRDAGGTGFFITPDGFIVTNNHVVENATRIEVYYGETNKSAIARVVGRDPATDLALLKIDVDHEVPTVRLGDSDSARVGDWVIAIGNPLQFEKTLTVGVVSAKGRSLGISEATASFENFIQTDAAINRGNSGGPLCNINGEVIAINTAISGMGQNLGFATPVNILKRIYPQLREHGSVTRGFLGITIAEVTHEIGRAFNLPNTQGALVHSVGPDSPASRAGIQHGDVIVQIDDREIRSNRDLIDYVSDQAPNTRIRIQLLRLNDRGQPERRTVTATTGERPATGVEPEREADPAAPVRNRIGISVQEITPTARQQMGLPDEARGVVVTSVRPVSPAADAGILRGDVITEVNRQQITGVEQLRQLIDRSRPGDYLRMYVTTYARGGRGTSRFAIVQVPADAAQR
jgi:serine protease Do